MSDKNILDELFGLASEAGDLVDTIKLKREEETALRRFEPEALDSTVIAHYRTLIDAVTDVRITKEVDCYRLHIGTGLTLRVYDGASVGAAILFACEKEGLSLSSRGGF